MFVFETEFEIKFRDSVSDTFTEDIKPSQSDLDSAVEEHVQDWCNEHNISRDDVKIISTCEV